MLWIDPDLVSASPEGDQTDGLPLVRDRVGRIAGHEKTYDLLLQRVPREDGVSIWKFAGATVADIPNLYAEFGYGRLEAVFPPWFFDVQVLGIEVWFWVAFMIVAGLAFPVAMALTAALIALRRRIHPPSAEEMATFLTGPLRFLIAVLLVRGLMGLTGLSLVVQALTQAATLVFVALAWLGLRLLYALFAQRIARYLEARGVVGTIILIKPAASLFKLVILIGAGLLWLDNLAFKVTTLLAGISISGIAVALVFAKEHREHFPRRDPLVAVPAGEGRRFLPLRRPDRNHRGRSGLRATRVRTLDRTIINVANAEFVRMHVENYSKRDRFWYHPCLKLRYETTPEQIRVCPC